MINISYMNDSATVGFIYIITNLINGMKYIGCKKIYTI